MISKDRLKDIVTQSSYSRKEKVLICLAVDPVAPQQVKSLRGRLTGAGVRAAAKWNLSQLLSDLDDLVARTDSGWEITTNGYHKLAELVGPYAATPNPKIASGLRHHLAGISNPDTRAFVEEAVRCYESNLHRAAVVLSWVGAMSIMYDHVVAKYLLDFNQEALRRNGKWKDAKGPDDLAKMREYDFLQVIAAISMIGKNVKQELEKRLVLRNGCGHPNTLQLGESMVGAHIEALVLNVYSRF